MEGPRLTPIYASAVKRQTWLGADRRIMICIFTVTAVLCMVALIAPLFWLLVPTFTGMVWALKLVRGAYKKDPMFLEVYTRSTRFLDYYSAKSGLYAKGRRTPNGWI